MLGQSLITRASYKDKMLRQTSLVTIWVIAWISVMVIETDSVKLNNCLQLIQRNFWNSSVYNSDSQQLFLQFNNSYNSKLNKCLGLTKPGTTYKLQLVSLGNEEPDRCCDLECPSSSIYIEEDVTDLVHNNIHNVSFQYVTGRYFLRLVRVVNEAELSATFFVEWKC